MTAQGLREAWGELVAVLAARAPRTLAEIRPPVPGASADLEGALGFEPSEELQTWFELHDGSGTDDAAFSLLVGTWMLPHEEAVKESQVQLDIYQDPELYDEPPPDLGPLDEAEAGTWAGTWCRCWIAIGSWTTGDFYFVDDRPGEMRGCVRLWENVDTDGPPDWASLEAMVRFISSSIAGRGPVSPSGAVAEIEDGIVTWDWPDD